VSNAEPLAQRVGAAMTENWCFAQRRDPVLDGPSEAVRDHHDVAAADLAEPEATVTSRADRPVHHRQGEPATRVVFMLYRATMAGSAWGG